VSPQISWHRGGKELATSATLAAFESAAERGGEWVEVDVQRTRDGVLVCVHDAALPGLGRIDQLDYGNLPERELARVPTFAEFLEVLRRGGERAGDPTGSGVHLDLKGTGHELQAVDAVLDTGRPVFVTTLHEDSVALVRRERPQVRALLSLPRVDRGLPPLRLFKMWLQDLWPYRRLQRIDASGIAVQFLVAHAPLRRWCRRRDLTVLVWTVNRQNHLGRWLSRRDVDIVTTDRPVLATSLRAAAVVD
jgi:glycerophosphoryl diester phosphodiesterase